MCKYTTSWRGGWVSPEAIWYQSQTKILPFTCGKSFAEEALAPANDVLLHKCNPFWAAFVSLSLAFDRSQTKTLKELQRQ